MATDFAASLACADATLFRIIWWFAADMVKGAESFNPLVETVPVTLSVVLVVAVEVDIADFRESRFDDVVEIIVLFPAILLFDESLEEGATKVSEFASDERLKVSVITGVSVSIGTEVSLLDFALVLSG